MLESDNSRWLTDFAASSRRKDLPDTVTVKG